MNRQIRDAIDRMSLSWTEIGLRGVVPPARRRLVVAYITSTMRSGAELAQDVRRPGAKRVRRSDDQFDRLWKGVWMTTTKMLDEGATDLIDQEILDEVEDILQGHLVAMVKEIWPARLPSDRVMGVIIETLRGAIIAGFCMELVSVNSDAEFSD